MNTQAKYFLIAVVLIGSAGIWLPMGVELLVNKTVMFHNIPPNVTTYFISILFAGCIDYFLGKLRSINLSGIQDTFLNIVIILIVGVALVVLAIVFSVLKYDTLSFILGIIGVLISYRIWWVANVDNPNFTNGSLGGNASKPLING